ncbi:LacI family DNA-binding transcriptional regulator [uncultured Litoreibacter sp.]|uniref:LacI family DNA-binding transcriptional regulator n=1 Tax=uncultured Litoreibacter sp. TaxID=1392394 RepID=UPI00262FBBE1|nr:LacI family DNA-binding transcriptional regulator [uncultured Litoreibacter sp.]
MASKQSGKADIVDVARAAKVSASTVSRCFNHPELVNPATRRKIERAIAKLGYIRNRAAQAMHGKRSGTIGLIVPTINHAIFAEVVQSFSDSVEQAGFTILMTSHGYDLDREYDVLRKLLEHRVDGIALIGLAHSEKTYTLIEQQQVPCVAIWNHDAASRVSCVGAENFAAGRMAAEHIVGLGHRRVGMIFPQTDGNDRAQGRLDGAWAVLDDVGIEVPEAWQMESPYSIAQAKEAVGELLNSADVPSALICGNDVIAQGAVFAALKLGVRVPEDLSVVGIGNFKGSLEMEPGLTTVHIPAQDIGRIAGEQIVATVAADTPELVRVRCEVDLVVRGTTRAII